MSPTRVEVATTPPYEVVVGPGALGALELPGGPAAVLTDERVADVQAAKLAELGDLPRFLVPATEASKSFATLERVLDFLVASGLDRSSTLIAFGGGVVGDLGGLAASLFMRGIAVVQAPTTLLAMCDSAIGGKTAVNLAGGKNLAGTFHQPRQVLADTSVLATLPETELASGLGEVVKTALVGDPELLALLESTPDRVLARDPELFAEIVTRCARVKGGVVARDEREGDERRKLNLGHTFGHAIERVAGYGAVPHGEAVAVGLVLAARTAERVGLASVNGLPDRLTAVLGALGVAADLDALRKRTGAGLTPEELIDAMRHDKKGKAGAPAFVLPRAIGDLACGVAVQRDALLALLA